MSGTASQWQASNIFFQAPLIILRLYMDWNTILMITATSPHLQLFLSQHREEIVASRAVTVHFHRGYTLRLWRGPLEKREAQLVLFQAEVDDLIMDQQEEEWATHRFLALIEEWNPDP